MPRRPRVCPAGEYFHVLNRAVARLPLFEKTEDFEAFERVLADGYERERLPILAYTLMPNHWHFVVCPETNNQLSEFRHRQLEHVQAGVPLGPPHDFAVIGRLKSSSDFSNTLSVVDLF